MKRGKVFCTECGSTDVQCCQWFKPNTGEQLDMLSDTYERIYKTTWCEGCEDHTTLADEQEAVEMVARFCHRLGHVFRGRDLSPGMVVDKKRVRELVGRVGTQVVFTYDYLVDENVWHREAIPPVAAVACSKVIRPEWGMPE